jgi:glycerol kinase
VSEHNEASASGPRQVLLAIDQGTTGTTALLLDRDVRVVAAHNVEFPNHYPKPGWVEHEAAEIWESVEQAVLGAVLHAGGFEAVQILAVGITNQRETSLFWDRVTGEPAHRALVWQDRRTADQCAALKAAGHEDMVRAKTGLVLDPYFSATKARWVLDAVPGLRARAEAGELCFGTIDSYLVWRLCGAHVTDASNASAPCS